MIPGPRGADPAAPAARPATAGREMAPVPVAPSLPAWPLVAMFALMPLWWAVGAFYLAWPVFGVALLALLAIRGRVALPPGTVVWLAFLGLVLVSFTQLDRPTGVLTAGLRLAFYATALVVGVYAYQLARGGPAGRAAVWRALCLFWLGLVALGWLGVLAPQLSLTSVTEALLPAGVATEPFIFDMVHLSSTEAQTLATDPRYRPSAPFAYTNNWGSSWALLLPCVVAYLMRAPAGWWRRLLLASIPLSLVPAFLTLNRVMFLSLGVGLAVVAVRALLRGDRRLVLAVAGLLAAGWLATYLIPVLDLIGDRVDSSGTNSARLFLYQEVLQRIGQSPFFGYGAPMSVDVIDAPPIGSQGQLWLVLFSHGIPALLCFLGWFVVVAVRGLTVSSSAGRWLAVVPVVALVQIPFYGVTFQNLSLVFLAAGLLLALAGPGAARVAR